MMADKRSKLVDHPDGEYPNSSTNRQRLYSFAHIPLPLQHFNDRATIARSHRPTTQKEAKESGHGNVFAASTLDSPFANDG
jgi:hypothetical protein